MKRKGFAIELFIYLFFLKLKTCCFFIRNRELPSHYAFIRTRVSSRSRPNFPQIQDIPE